MAQLDKGLRAYLLAYAVLLMGALMPILLSDQNELFLTLNKYHNVIFDKLFTWLTLFGDGLTFAVLIVVLTFISYRQALLGLVIFLSTAAVSQVLKRLVFDDQLRPFGVLGKDHNLYIPEGIEPLVYNSFPSGHTTTAFALAFFLSILFKKQNLWPVFLVLAVLGGYSRIYLTHHFPIDVWAGSLIGTIGALLLYAWLDPKLARKFGNKGLLRQ